MAYNGDSKKIVSSSFLYSTLQTFYTKIKGLLDNKADKDHTHNFTATDADKLDGYHASDLVLLKNFIVGNLGSKAVYYSLASNKDCNEIEEFLVLSGGADGLHYPIANTFYYILTLKYNDTAKKQIAFGYKGTEANNIVFRTCSDGVWSDWRSLTTASSSNCLVSTGFGDTNLTYYQTAGEFYDNTGWCHYLIANHGNGETYYNYTIALPFWDIPKYQRQGGGAATKTGWHQFYTSENITYGTTALTPGSSSLKSGYIYLQYE